MKIKRKTLADVIHPIEEIPTILQPVRSRCGFSLDESPLDWKTLLEKVSKYWQVLNMSSAKPSLFTGMDDETLRICVEIVGCLALRSLLKPSSSDMKFLLALAGSSGSPLGRRHVSWQLHNNQGKYAARFPKLLQFLKDIMPSQHLPHTRYHFALYDVQLLEKIFALDDVPRKQHLISFRSVLLDTIP